MRAEILVRCVKKGKPGQWPLTDIRASTMGEPPPIVGEVEAWVARDTSDLPFRPVRGAVIGTKAYPVEPTHAPLAVESVEIDTDNDRVVLHTQTLWSDSDQEHQALLERFRSAGWAVRNHAL